MQEKLVAQDPNIWVLVLAPGEEVKETLTAFARRHKIMAASFVALGALERATIGYFDWQKKAYQPIAVDEQVEVLPWWATSPRMTRANRACMPTPYWAVQMAQRAADIC